MLYFQNTLFNCAYDLTAKFFSNVFSSNYFFFCKCLFIKGIIARNTLVMYDRENSKMGFWKTNCSELWERLHRTGAPAPSSSASNRTNSTIGMPPTLAPSNQLQYILPGSGIWGILALHLIWNHFLSVPF